MLSELFIIFICSLLAFALSAICGGGAGLMILPVLGRLLPVTQIPAALSIGTFTSSASRVIIFKKNIRWQIVKYFVPAALPAVWLGAWLLKFVNPVYLEIIIGLFLVSNIPFLFKKPAINKEEKKASNIALTLIGFLAGFLSGLTGAVGLVFNKFYLSYGLTKEEIIATRAANEILLHLVKIVLYSLFGLIGTQVLWTGCVVALAAIISSWSMKWILPKLSITGFKKIGYFAMVFSGLLMLYQGTRSLANEKKIKISSVIKSKNLEAKLQWQNADYAMELSFDEGFEFEQVVPFSILTDEQQKMINLKNSNGYRVVIEKVYTIGHTSYEAYFYEADTLVMKFDFE